MKAKQNEASNCSIRNELRDGFMSEKKIMFNPRKRKQLIISLNKREYNVRAV